MLFAIRKARRYNTDNAIPLPAPPLVSVQCYMDSIVCIYLILSPSVLFKFTQDVFLHL